ncbi:hypothetical protein ACWJJH_14815 [Endozoicomonadaceae bacterium StTr2]
MMDKKALTDDLFLSGRYLALRSKAPSEPEPESKSEAVRKDSFSLAIGEGVDNLDSLVRKK